MSTSSESVGASPSTVMLTHSGGCREEAPVDEVITCDYLGPHEVGGN